MSVSINNKIHQRGVYTAVEQNAASKILPGMLCETIASSTVNGVVTPATVQAHSTINGAAGENWYALEDALQGRTTADTYLPGGSVGGTTDNGTNIGDPVQGAIQVPGNMGLALLLAGTHYTVGLKLGSHGDGKLYTYASGKVFAIVLDDTDLSPSGSLDKLVSVRYL